MFAHKNSAKTRRTMKEISLVPKSLQLIMKAANPKVQKFLSRLLLRNSKLHNREIEFHAEITSLKIKNNVLQSRVDSLIAKLAEKEDSNLSFEALLPEDRLELVRAIDSIKARHKS